MHTQIDASNQLLHLPEYVSRDAVTSDAATTNPWMQFEIMAPHDVQWNPPMCRAVSVPEGLGYTYSHLNHGSQLDMRQEVKNLNLYRPRTIPPFPVPPTQFITQQQPIHYQQVVPITIDALNQLVGNGLVASYQNYSLAVNPIVNGRPSIVSHNNEVEQPNHLNSYTSFTSGVKGLSQENYNVQQQLANYENTLSNAYNSDDDGNPSFYNVNQESNVLLDYIDPNLVSPEDYQDEIIKAEEDEFFTLVEKIKNEDIEEERLDPNQILNNNIDFIGAQKLLEELTDLQNLTEDTLKFQTLDLAKDENEEELLSESFIKHLLDSIPGVLKELDELEEEQTEDKQDNSHLDYYLNDFNKRARIKTSQSCAKQEKARPSDMIHSEFIGSPNSSPKRMSTKKTSKTGSPHNSPPKWRNYRKSSSESPPFVPVDLPFAATDSGGTFGMINFRHKNAWTRVKPDQLEDLDDWDADGNLKYSPPDSSKKRVKMEVKRPRKAKVIKTEPKSPRKRASSKRKNSGQPV